MYIHEKIILGCYKSCLVRKCKISGRGSSFLGFSKDFPNPQSAVNDILESSPLHFHPLLSVDFRKFSVREGRNKPTDHKNRHIESWWCSVRETNMLDFKCGCVLKFCFLLGLVVDYFLNWKSLLDKFRKSWSLDQNTHIKLSHCFKKQRTMVTTRVKLRISRCFHKAHVAHMPK